MNGALRILLSVLIGIMFVQVLPANSQEEKWTGNLRDGSSITKEDLDSILEKHKIWIESEEKEGERADLVDATLVEADLRKADLREANLRYADLQKAKLEDADLRDAKLNDADLREAGLRRANLRRAHLFRADLRKADLRKAILEKAVLTNAELQEANLSNANLRKAYLTFAKLDEANLRGSELGKAYLSGAQLRGAFLIGTDLSKADLENAILSGANLRRAKMKQTDLTGTDLYDAIFDPIDLINAKGLEGLRDIFKEKRGSNNALERLITYKNKRDERKNLGKGNLPNMIESLFNFIFFELTCEYGLKRGQPLTIVVMLIFFFSVPYIFVLVWPPSKDGIWKIWSPDRVREDLPLAPKEPKERLRLKEKPFSAIKFGFYFSLLSAFSIGFKEINVRNWIIRLQRKEYILRPTGWVKTVSGLQSLISVYLLALWVLTYFGRVFESF